MRTRLSQFLEAVAVATPTAIKELASEMAVYANDAAYESALGAGTEGDIYFNSTIQMLRIYKNSAWENFTADEIDYDNTVSGLTAATVQDAIDEVNSDLSDHIAATEAHGIASGAAVMGTQGSTLDAVFYGIADDASTGTDQTLTPTKINMRLTGVTGGDTLAGLVPTNTKLLILINDTANALSILNESAAATATNRILTGTGANLSMGAGTSITLIYDDTEARWRVVGGSGAGLSDPMTTRGDIIYRDASNTTARLATGIMDQIFKSDGVDSYWSESDGEFNYIANSDAASGTGNTSTTANVTLAQTLVTAELPEPRKLTAFKVSASGAATDGSDYAQWDAKIAWADADSTISALSVKVKSTGGWKFVAWNVTDNEAMGPESEEIIGDKPVLLEVYPIADKFPAVRAIPTTGTPSDIFVSGVKIVHKIVSKSGVTTKWKPYPSVTPTNFTLSNNSLEWRYAGDNLEVRGTMTINTSSAAIAELPTPNGEVIKYDNTVTNIVGDCYQNAASALVIHGLATNGDNFFEFSQDNGATDKTVAVNANIVFLAADVIRVNLSVPVDIDNSSLTGTEAQLQNAKGRFYRSAGGGYSSGTTFVFDTTDTTTFEAPIGINNSSGVFSVAIAGIYDIICVLSANPAWASNTQMTLHVNRNGGGYNQERVITRPGASSFTLNGQTSVYLTPNDLFLIQVNDTVTINQGSSLCYIEIRRRSNRSAQGIGFPFLGDTTTGTKETGMVVKQSATTDIGAAPSQTDFNNLLQKLRDAGILAT